MANKKKNYYYVLVFTDDGPVYVTSVDNASRVAYWEKDKAPLTLPKHYAEDLTIGLNLNYNNAVVVASKWELTQPYNYKCYDCTFVEKYPDEC